MTDYINRRDAINLLKKWSDGYAYIEIETESAIKNFQHLPAADVVDANTCIECQAGMGQKITNAIANTCFWLSAEQWSELTKVIDEVFKC